MCFIGLFYPAPGKSSVNPIVRFGKVCCNGTATVRVESRPDELDMYLVEGWAFGGTSGSPAFSYYEYYEKAEMPDSYSQPGLNETTSGIQRSRVTMSQVDPRLLGIVYGKLTENLCVVTARKASEAVAANVGVAGITPSGKLWDLLMAPKFVRTRAAIAELANEKATAVMHAARPHMHTDWETSQPPKKSK